MSVQLTQVLFDDGIGFTNNPVDSQKNIFDPEEVDSVPAIAYKDNKPVNFNPNVFTRIFWLLKSFTAKIGYSITVVSQDGSGGQVLTQLEAAGTTPLTPSFDEVLPINILNTYPDGKEFLFTGFVDGTETVTDDSGTTTTNISINVYLQFFNIIYTDKTANTYYPSFSVNLDFQRSAPYPGLNPPIGTGVLDGTKFDLYTAPVDPNVGTVSGDCGVEFTGLYITADS